MHGLRVLLLGRPRLEFDGQPLARRLAPKHQAVVYYLASQDGPVSRSELAALLWSELDEPAARANLRVALTRLRQWLPGMLQTDGQQVALDAGVQGEAALYADVRALRRAAQGHGSAADRAAAADAWRGPFLEGFDLASEGFEQWLSTARQRVQREAVTLRRALAQVADESGRTDGAIAHWRALLDIDDTDEDAHMALMRLLAGQGRRTAAIAQYEACRATLAERLGARPSAACYALYATIHADGATASASRTAAGPWAATSQGSMPPSPAATRGAGEAPEAGEPLIGRAEELGVLAERLRDPECRWLSIVGPGGIGKTRLALAAASRLAPFFRQGVLVLSGRESDGALRDDETLAQQVLDRTGSERFAAGALLLVLDNLETVSGVRSMAQTLHSRAPGVVVLATSRCRLGVPREWLLELQGLSLARDGDGRPASSPAARLFAAAVRARDPRADLDAQAADVEALCARLGGYPMALELAAHGAVDTGLRATLARVREGALPEDRTRGDGERHRSMAVVLDDAWARLPEDARAAAIRLAWLPGPSDLALAEAVGTPAESVTTLRAHAWLARDVHDRLWLHPLQQDFLRGRPGANAARSAVLAALAAHQLERLPAIEPLGRWPASAGDAARIASSPPFGPSMLEEAREQQMGSDHAAASVRWVDAVVALLLAADRADEAAALLERAERLPGIPLWRRTAWTLRHAEVCNGLGDSIAALQLYETALADAGFGGERGDGSTRFALATVRGIVRALRTAGWPLEAHERAAFTAAMLRGMAMWTQLRSSSRPVGSMVANVVVRAVAWRAGTQADRWAVHQLSAYGLAVFGHPRLARLLQRRLQHRPPVRHDPVLEGFVMEGACATRIAIGDWAGVEDDLARATALLECHGAHRQAQECRSLAGKLRFYDGRLRLAYETFADCTERSLRRPGGAWRAWGPVGQAETGLCLGDVPMADLRRLADAGSHWITEMESMDSAYTVRRCGLMARLAWLDGDAVRAREAVLAGVSAAQRMPSCGFWAHEGFAGLGDTLLALRRHERRVAGALPPLDRAWGSLMKSVDAHVRRFSPAIALRERLRGEHLFDDGRADGLRVLRRAVALAERAGMRVELARACNTLGRGTNAATWSERAGMLWRAMGCKAG